ncbi:MAG: hypothetical protein V4710_06170 [Verrucomicrobiota bacterium]
MATLSVAVGHRQLSESSSARIKVELLSDGALNDIVGDLKQEIAAGSIVNPGSNLYEPNSSNSATPVRVAASPLLPNLVKQSIRNRSFYEGGSYSSLHYPPSNRASEIETDSVSLNGRFISRERWNKHLLLPKSHRSARDSTTTEPADEFVTPDWILVSRDGSNPEKISSDVIGRYAYCIFDEGGLLDANVAGHPLDPPTSRKRPGEMTATQGIEVSRKGCTAFADLTEIGLTRFQVNQLVGWRNYASAKPSGTFPSLRFDSDPARIAMDRYNHMVHSNVAGFLSVASTPLHRKQSDRMFTSRQELMRFLLYGVATTSLQRARIQSSLQYLGTFSRDINQPSFCPDSRRPKIVGQTPATPDLQAYDGNNDSQGLDDRINPPLLKIRAPRQFTHLDGTPVKVGEPLVKRRFPLQRLALLTPTAVSRADNESAIHRYFGLSRSHPSQPWIYNHAVSGSIIGRLEEINNLTSHSREPDFVELLKAAICAGSLGKSAATEGIAGAYMHARNISVDYHILQIFANIIDQFDADGFPTRISLADGTEFHGVENVPYFYRYRVGTLQTRLPQPTGTGAWKPVKNAPPLIEPGAGAFLFFPEIWNPHDQNSTMGSPRPTEFRVLVDAVPTPGKLSAPGQVMTRANFIDAPVAATQTEASHPLDATRSELLFEVPDQSLFREPTLLGRPDVLKKAALRTGNGHALRGVPGADANGEIKDASTFLTDPKAAGFVGVYLGSFPLRRVWNRPGDPKPPQIYSTGSVDAELSTSTLSVRMQFKDGHDHWVTYDQKLIHVNGLHSDLNGSHPGVRPYLDGALPGLNNSWGHCSDPRTSRFGIASGVNPPRRMLNTRHGALPTSRPDRGAGWEATGSGAPGMGFDRPITNGTIGWAPDGLPFGTRMAFRPGLLCQNGSNVSNDQCVDGKPNSSAPAPPLFYRDPDGVPRRGMAAYVSSGQGWSAFTETGLPLVTATKYPDSTPTERSRNRPLVLNRAFRSVAELGYVFRDLPWKQIDFFTPESGDAALLDFFCIGELSTPDALVAGKINLNTLQTPVLRAVLSGAYKDEIAALPNASWKRTPLPPLSSGEVHSIANALVARTRDNAPNRGPMRNVSELVGKYVPDYRNAYDQPFDGFSRDLDLYDGGATGAASLIQRFRETAIRAISDVGTTRVWNLMIDLIVQSGKYPPQSKNPGKFFVESERRVWLHVAIDRWTGEVLDRQLEVVSE